MKKKILSICLVAVLAATAIVGGTLAYFTDTDENNNVFTVGNVDISLDEAAVSREGDIWTADAQADRVKANTYESIYPGVVLPKDPTVHNDGSYDAYVRVKITVDFNKLAGMQADKKLFNDATADGDLTNILNIDAENWTYVNYVINFPDREVTYTYTYNTALAAGTDTTAVFTEVSIPAALTNEDVKDYGLESFNLDIVAEAIQTAGFADAAAAWAAFDAE